MSSSMITVIFSLSLEKGLVDGAAFRIVVVERNDAAASTVPARIL